MGEIEVGTDVLIIGSGPAGYTAAIRCGQQELDTTLVGTQIGGVCLNLGCIPYKSLLHSLGLMVEARESEMFGVKEQAALDLKRAQEWKDKVIARLQGGISRLLEASGVAVMDGICSFESSSEAIVKTPHGNQRIRFKRAVIATGSHFKMPEDVRMDSPRIMTPYGMARIDHVPESAVVLGGGLGGATTSSLLAKMGAKVTLAFSGRSLIAAVDDDVLQPAMQWLERNGATVLPEASWQVSPDGSEVKISSCGKDHDLKPDLVVFSTPQEPNIRSLNLQSTGVKLNDKGFIEVDDNFRTADQDIYAIGDVLGGARNASTAFREGIAVATVLAGKPGLPEYQAMPFTIYAEPEIASAGINEKQAKKKGLDVIIDQAPYSSNGAAALSGNTTGLAKVIADRASHRILGVQIVGRNATDMIAEGLLAIEMGARLEDVALTLHPHPALCEVFYEACARAAGLSSNVAPQR